MVTPSRPQRAFQSATALLWVMTRQQGGLILATLPGEADMGSSACVRQQEPLGKKNLFFSQNCSQLSKVLKNKSQKKSLSAGQTAN